MAVRIRQDGALIADTRRTADAYGDPEVQRLTANTASADAFFARAVDTGSGQACTGSVTYPNRSRPQDLTALRDIEPWELSSRAAATAVTSS